MAPNPRRINARLDELYSRLPQIACQGLCYDACGLVPTSIGERVRIERASGRQLGVTACNDCTMLNDRRCSVYDVRPMICRLWGIVENLRCPYGCVPDGGLMSVGDGYAFLAESMDIAGFPPELKSLANKEIQRQLQDPAFRREAISHHIPTVNGRSTAATVLHRDQDNGRVR